MFCKDNGIELSHGAPRTPTTQGLTERSNLSWKQDMRSLIVSTADKNIKKWCTRERPHRPETSHTTEPSKSPLTKLYIRNKTSQGKAKWTEQRKPIWTRWKWFGRKQWKKFTTTTRWRPTKKMTKNNRKPNKIQRSHGEPNKEKAREKTAQVQSSWYGGSKNWQRQENNLLDPNMLLGKITSTEESGFVQIVTQYGKINTLISPSRLYPCSATTVQLNYSSEISFTAAC